MNKAKQKSFIIKYLMKKKTLNPQIIYLAIINYTVHEPSQACAQGRRRRKNTGSQIELS